MTILFAKFQILFSCIAGKLRPPKYIEIKKIGPQFDLIRVNIHQTLKGVPTISSGVATTVLSATKKAISEYFENYHFIDTCELEESRSGWASHINVDIAISKAKNELFERDAVLCALQSLNSISTSVPNKYKGVKAATIPSANSDLHVAIAGKKTKQGYWILGSGSSLESDRAAINCAIEELFSLYDYWHNKILKNVVDRKTKILWDHLNSTKDPQVSLRIESLLTGRGYKKPTFPIVQDSDFSVEVVSNIGQYVVKCTCYKLIPFKLGNRWDLQKDLVTSMIFSRGLDLADWGPHPLL